MITSDLECPRHDYCIIWSYDVTGADFENSLYAFGQSEKSLRVQCIINEVIGDPRPIKLYGFLFDQQSKDDNWISIFITYFWSLFSQAIELILFSFFVLFWEIIKESSNVESWCHKNSTASCPLPAWRPNTNSVVATYFSQAILVTVELPVFFSVYQPFCSNHFAISVSIFEVFTCNSGRIILSETRRSNWVFIVQNV